VIGRRHDVEDYAGYGKMIEQLKADSFESNLASGAAWVGTPKQIVKQINAYAATLGIRDRLTASKLQHDPVRRGEGIDGVVRPRSDPGGYLEGGLGEAKREEFA